MPEMVNGFHISTVSTGQIGGPHTQLVAVNINTKVAAGILTLYNGTSTAGPVMAVIDCSGATTCLQYEGVRFPAGLFYGLAGGAADITISYI